MKVISKVSKAKWNEIVKECSYATFFHTYEWAKIIRDTFDHYNIATKLFIFQDETEVILPLVSSNMGFKGFFKSYQSMIPGVYGNLLSNKRLSNDKIEQIFKSLLKVNVASMFIIGNPFAPYNMNMPDYFERKSIFTQILRLEDGFNNLWRNFTKGHKSSAKKSKRIGVTIDVAKSIEDYEEYFNIYQDSIKRWGEKATSNYPYILFKNLYSIKSLNIKLWLAKFNSQIISGALVFYCNKHVVWWHGTTLSEYFDYCPSNLLQTEIIKDACNKKYKIYDFNPSGGHEGVVKFKKSFGAQNIEFNCYKLKNSTSYRVYER